MTITTSNPASRLTGEALLAKDTGTRVRPTRDEIGRLAYHFYVTRGRHDGHDVDDWLLAERELVHHYRPVTNPHATRSLDRQPGSQRQPGGHIIATSRGEQTT